MASEIVKDAKQARELAEQITLGQHDEELRVLLKDITRYARNGCRSMSANILSKAVADQLQTLGFTVILNASVSGGYFKISW